TFRGAASGGFHHVSEASVTFQNPDSPPPATDINSLLLPSHHHRSIPQNQQTIQRSPAGGDRSIELGDQQRARMEGRMFGLETPLMTALQHLLDVPDGESGGAGATGGEKQGPTRAYVRDARAMAATPADVKELPGAYAFVVDVPGLGSGDIKVQVEDERVLVISGERRREEKEDARYLRMERRMGKLMRKFVLPENADTEKISAVCRDGVLTVSVQKLPPPEPKKPKAIQVQVA
uniref:SHSP domain-containing protein n=4 Tax=Aegilops tauschii TaxID=37682 RepID=A0A453E7L0_AEGTS